MPVPARQRSTLQNASLEEADEAIFGFHLALERGEVAEAWRLAGVRVGGG